MSCCRAVGIELGIGCHNSACYRCSGFGVCLLHRRYCEPLGTLNGGGNIADVRSLIFCSIIVIRNLLYRIEPTIFVILNALNIMPLDEYCLFFAYKADEIDQLLDKYLTALQRCVFPSIALIKRQQSCWIFHVVGFEQMHLGCVIGGVILTDDKGSTYRFEQSGCNVWRSSFDKWLADRAAAAGAEIVEETAAIACEQTMDAVIVTLKTNERTYTEQARYVVDCEGVTGALKRKLTGRALEYITTYQTYNRGGIDLDPHFFYAWLQPELSQYDAWFNVKDQQLVLGVSVVDGERIGEYFSRFIAYMKEKHGLRIDKQLKEDKWLLHRVRPGCPIDYGVGRVFFAGETAGFLNPMGEGVSSAIESGYLLGEAIQAHFNDPKSVLSAYQTAVRPLQDYMKRQWHLISAMSDAFREMKV